MKRIIIMGISLIFVGCATNKYEQQASTTDQLTGSAARYAVPAGLGAGGYFAGKELGGSTEAGILGAAAGVGLGAATTYITDEKQARVAAAAKEEGKQEARAELSIEEWKRNAIYNAPPAGSTGPLASGGAYGSKGSRFRTVYVPKRVINGVEYPATTQNVEVAN